MSFIIILTLKGRGSENYTKDGGGLKNLRYKIIFLEAEILATSSNTLIRIFWKVSDSLHIWNLLKKLKKLLKIPSSDIMAKPDDLAQKIFKRL